MEQRLALTTQSWNLAADFAADFVAGLPQDNPNGVWTYLASDGTTTSLLKTNGANPDTFGVGAGWAEANGIPSYARGGVFGFPIESMTGHGSNQIVFTAPAELDLGGVELTGLFTQAMFEPERQMQMRIYKNDSYGPLVTVTADFTLQTTIVSLPATRIAMQPGDTLIMVIDGLGPLGNGTATFAAWNVVIQEIQLDGDYNTDGAVDAADYVVWRKSLGSTTELAADGNGSGMVDPVDHEIWKANFGRRLDSGIIAPEYHPGAIVVQTTGVTRPDGSLLDISGSQTQGLREAFDFSAEQGWDVFVLPGTYTLNAHLDIEELQLRAFRFEDVTLNFTSNVTDFGIRFDSTMLTNLYWKGGAINAPSATHGVLFQPRTPHPKDGPIYGTIGVVDSYFHFNVPITAATHKVTMDSSQATINDIVFHFASVPADQINYVGGGFAPYNIFEAPRTDDPIPFDLFSPAGRVTINAPLADFRTGLPGTVFLPDGYVLDVTGTRTFGLQEAFDYAAANNLDVVVFGRGIRNVSPFSDVGLYDLFEPLVVGDLTDRMYRIYAVTFGNNPQTGTLMLGDMLNSSFEITGQVVGTGADNVVVVRPDGAGIHNSAIRIQAAVGSNGAQDTAVRLDPSSASIQDSLLYFHEVNMGYFGIKIMSPSATTEFSNNLVRTLHTHAIAHIGVQVGEGIPYAERIHSNTFDVRTATEGVFAEASLQVWGDFNTFDLFAGYSGQNFGAKFEPGSNDNTMRYSIYQALTPIADFGVNNTFIPHGSGSGMGASLSSLVEADGMSKTLASMDFSARRTITRRVPMPITLDMTEEDKDLPSSLFAVPNRREGDRQRDEAAIDAALDAQDEPTGLLPTLNLSLLEGLAVNWIKQP